MESCYSPRWSSMLELEGETIEFQKGRSVSENSTSIKRSRNPTRHFELSESHEISLLLCG